jgi:putative chitinase
VFPATPAQWAHFLGGCGVKAAVAALWAEAFHAECTAARFNLGERELDDFMAEALHETAMLTATAESLKYRAARIRELGGVYGPGSRWARAAASADALAARQADGTPYPDADEREQALAEVLYGGRFGNDSPGDGWKYRGRGIPILTGLPLVDRPELLEDRAVALRVALAWWEDKIPDAAIDYPERTRKLVQGGQLGLDHTRQLAAAAREGLRAFA